MSKSKLKIPLSDFDFDLPKNLIGQKPIKPRDHARLLILDKKSGATTHKYFYDLPEILKSGDTLVFNDSKVIPARLEATSCDRKYEVLLVKKIKEEMWECWLRPGKKAKIGEIFRFNNKLSAKLIRRNEDIFVLEFDKVGDEFIAEIKAIGQVPLPPYILKQRVKKRGKKYQKSDIKNYQTIYAKTPGSVAAPTAGLHFDKQIIERLSTNGIQFEKVTLHVSLGTFQPVSTEKIEDFTIHSEYFEMTKKTAENLNQAKCEGRRIIAVGTTSVRVLETVAELCHCEEGTDEAISGKRSPRPNRSRDDERILKAISGETNIYIYPGYKFKFVDGIITNFHLPKSSLLLLVSAFAGKEKIDKAYKHAIEKKYKFYSYGDGMLIE